MDRIKIPEAVRLKYKKIVHTKIWAENHLNVSEGSKWSIDSKIALNSIPTSNHCIEINQNWDDKIWRRIGQNKKWGQEPKEDRQLAMKFKMRKNEIYISLVELQAAIS